MAIYRCTVVKEGVAAINRGRIWRNVYDIDADTYESALAGADVIRIQEQTFHTDEVAFTKVTAHSLLEPPRRVGAQLLLSGELGAVHSDAEALPLWNVVRVDFADTGIGRPERKFYRVCLHTDMIDGLVLQSTFYDTVQAGADAMVALENYVGPSGEHHASAAVSSLVAMRQTGWHRRRRPGFVRGYVPV